MPVTYAPDNAVDGDPETTWRTPGNGAAQSLTLDFGGRVEVARVALIPRYAKIDPVDGTDRFRQNRIVRKVRWVFEDESSVVQTFEPRPELQFLDVRAFGSRVLIEILETTDHGGRDFTPDLRDTSLGL